MSAEIQAELDKVRRLVSHLEAAAGFLRTEYLEALLCEAVIMGVQKAQSPFVDRRAAAARWFCSESEIDRAARDGILTRHERNDTPLFSKSQGDEAIRTGKWKRRGDVEKGTLCKVA